MHFDSLLYFSLLFLENKELFMHFPFVLQASGVWQRLKQEDK